MFKRLFSAAMVFGAAALAPPVHAQTVSCLDRETLIDSLESRFSEQLLGGGLASPRQLVEVWNSPETGSFTVFVTRPDGTSCVVATGLHWQTAKPGVVDEPRS